MPHEPGPTRRYGLALATVLGAILLTPLLRDVLEPTPYLLYFGATLVSAWYGGVGPGAAAALLSFAAIEAISFLAPGALPLNPGNVRRLALFLLATLLLGRQSSARRRARSDLRFLADAGATLAASLDQEATLDAVARVAGARLADAAVVALGEETGIEPLSAVATDDEAVAEVLRALAAPNVAGSGGEVEIHRGLSEALLVRLAPDPATRARLRAMGIRSALIAPLRARGHTLGALVLLRRRFAWRWRGSERSLAGELARRAALAIDNARLYSAAVQMKEALRRRAGELAESDRRKDVFLAVLAHEMRGPLSALNSLTQVMRVRQEEAPATAWEMMARQLDVLTRLAEDLLDVARIAQGKVELRRSPVPLADVVADAVTAARPLLAARRHELSVELPPEPLWLDADRVRLAQVVINLLTNAAKYTEPGGRVVLSAERRGGEGFVSVRDTGVGIAPELLPRVFDLFTQGEATDEKGPGGLGLGLALVRRLVEMHGGRVEAYSDGRGKGSAFVVCLPLLKEEGGRVKAELAPSPIPPPPVLVPPRRVLVVDDNVDAAAALAMLLELGGHEVRVAHDGPAALGEAEAYRPDAVVLDIDLPGMDGYEVGRLLRRSPATRRAVLVALTGYAHDEHRRRCREAGFDHQLTKPVDPADLRRALTD